MKYTHLNEETKSIVELDLDTRIEYLYQPIWINYPKTIDVIKLLNSLLKRPKQPRMQNLLLIGESNIGKTSLINYFHSIHPNHTSEDEDGMSKVNKTLVIAQSPATADEKGLYVSILDTFWTPYRVTDSTVKLRYQVIHLMRLCNVKMLILDEIHNLLSGTASKQRTVMNAIKNLGNELLIPIVGVGTKDAALILHSDPQHASRFDIVNLPKWDLDKNFRSLLKSFEMRLPLKEASNLASKEKATLLYTISEGNLGDLHKLLIECCITTLETKSESISTDIIKQHKWVKKTHGLRRRNT
ncbi:MULTISPECIES: TniB family NTP-binding protein [unclassified Francisella]|uniref:TniB family NTP-binding protein n=1 Tax=unclassified Francisella TaxID=2610885 RepID=UPI002E2F0AFE|nr:MULTISPECIES: TniB family NTP-binding protein [unclassified Francisella]MED7819067.1 TniB family NTP-binding protein [Francisella sp. 19S2-4]MED7829904.1 TniB family NTP-binding protein [Francisella sp. 19S2-10]